jgi:HEAT repeat protein
MDKVAELTKTLSYSDADVRKKMVMDLGELENNRSVGPLIIALNDTHKNAQEHICEKVDDIIAYLECLLVI